MKRFLHTFATFLMLGICASSHAATVTVDWLKMQAGGTALAFNMLNDANAAVANGTLTANTGFTSTPVLIAFSNTGWVTTQPEVVDSVADIASLSALQLRVAGSAGSCSYQLDMRVPSNQALIVVVGGMLRNSTSATQAMGIEAMSDSGASVVTLRSMNAWTNGSIVLDQSASWDAPTQILSSDAGNTGDTRFAFFEIAPIDGANSRLRFSVPNGYASGTGDTIFIGLGAVVPEPCCAMLVSLGGAVLMRRRRTI